MKNKITNIVALICALLLAISAPINAAEKVLNDSLDFPQASSRTMTNGTIVFEAEDMVYEKTMLLQTDKAASAGKLLRVWGKYTPQADRALPEPNDPPDAYMDFVSDTSDPVYLWMRVKIPNNNSNSFHYNINGSAYGSKHLEGSMTGDLNAFKWVFITSFETFNAGQSIRLNIQYREPNMFFDKIMFTTDMAFTPVEMNDYPTGEGADYSGLFPLPPITPIEGHPRLVFTKSDIPQILKNIEHENMREVYEKTAVEADKTISAKFDKNAKRNYNAGMLNTIVCKALFYALGLRDEAHGRETVQTTLDYLETVRFDLTLGDETRAIGSTMMMGAAVYDWCYDLLTEEDKAYIIKRMKVLAQKTEVGYPPTGGQSIFGHGGEGEVLAYPLACGISVYDEDPEMYNLAAGRLFSEFYDARKMWNETGAHSVGYSYGITRFDWETMSNLMFLGMDKDSVIGDAEDIAEVSKWFMYSRLPNGANVKLSDDYVWSARTPRTWWPTPVTSFAFAAAQTDDPYVEQAALIEKFISGYAATYKTIIPDILIFNPDAETEFMDELPLARKTDYPLSAVQARTNWNLGMDSNAAIAHFEAREKQYNDHAHADLGSFQIYYKGYLAISGGSYNGQAGGWGTNHYWNYYTRSISKNCMTVFDSKETTWGSRPNDGGQKQSPDLYLLEEYLAQEDEAKTEAWYIGPNTDTPEFSFIKTNLTNAYGGEKVKNHERSMLFMDLDNDDYPAAVVVFDDITSSDKSFTKKWLMNTVLEPEISGNTSTVIRNDNGYNGKLVNKTLLPQNPSITTVGGEGKESFVNGVNYPNADRNSSYDSEQGGWRIEISPSENKTRDLFLNSMYVTDYDKELPELPMYMEETKSLAGVTVMDRAVYFSKGDQIKSSQSITLRDNGYDTVKCLVTDIESGLWKVTAPDGSFKVYMADADKNTLYFRGTPGIYTISKMASGEPDSVQYEKMSKPSYGDFMIYNPDEKLFNTLSSPTVIKDGVKLVPIKALFELYGGRATDENSSVTAEISDTAYRLTAGSTYASANGKTITLSRAPELIGGVLYANPEDLSCFKISYDNVANIMSISLKKYEGYSKQGFSNYIIPSRIVSEAKSEKGKEKLCDGDFSTAWEAEGIGKYAVLELDGVHSLGQIAIAYASDDGVSSFYDIEISEDGHTYNKISSGSTSESIHKIDLPYGTKAKYVKIKGNGSMLGKLNRISEVVLIRGGE